MRLFPYAGMRRCQLDLRFIGETGHLFSPHWSNQTRVFRTKHLKTKHFKKHGFSLYFELMSRNFLSLY